MKNTLLFISAMSLLLPLTSLSADQKSSTEAVRKRCLVYDWKPGDIIRVETAMYKQTHITLPEPALDVVWGPKELWETDNIENHIWVKPLNSSPQAAETTATAIGSSKNSYEFEFVRVEKLGAHCIVINANGALIKRTSWGTHASGEQLQAQVTLLQQQLQQARLSQAQVKEETRREVDAAVKTYRAAISSNYDWSRGSGWFANDAIESVHDDGRFTYIRLKTDEKGVLAVLAEIDGKTEILEKTYDAQKREYRIAGIYPRFILRAGQSELTITRKS